MTGTPATLEKRELETREIDDLLNHMLELDASDLFVCPGKAPAMRIRGEVRALDVAPTTTEQMDGFLDGLLSRENREIFESTGDLDAGYSLPSGMRYRLNIHRQSGLSALVARVLPYGNLTFRELNLPPHLTGFAEHQRGLILVTGATGSGKSTTLAALIHHINTHRTNHIVTIEDPIEFVHRDQRSRITQREVGTDTVSFNEALRHVVRESPDVILIGEMRDMESMQVGLSAALTGHLVVSTLHTINAAQTLQRIIAYFPESLRSQACMDLSLSLIGVISMRLLPTADGERRVPAVEVLTNTPGVARLIREQRVEEIMDLMKHSSDPGMKPFNRSLVDLYRSGLISYDVGQAYSSNPDEFRLMVQGMETGVDTFRGGPEIAGLGQFDMKSLLSLAVRHGASDLHLSVDRPPVYRINGTLHRLPATPLSTSDMRSLLFSILTSRQRSVFELDKEIDFSLGLENGTRFRVNAYFQRGALAIALRMIPSTIPAPEDLGIPPSVLELAHKPQGLILVVGPTGSGKTTTLATMVDLINQSRRCHIITIEDPIEYYHKSDKATVDQREVYADTKSFAMALKYVLRQDPDVIMVGEMRDLETISAVLTAAETGHLVLATLHTNDAAQTMDRVVDVFPPHQQSQIRTQLAACLLAVVSQRLLTRRGTDGRVAAFEVMMGTPAIRNIIREGKTHQVRSIMETSARDGMITMDRAIQNLYLAGDVTEEDALRAVINQNMITDVVPILPEDGAPPSEDA